MKRQGKGHVREEANKRQYNEGERMKRRGKEDKKETGNTEIKEESKGRDKGEERDK